MKVIIDADKLSKHYGTDGKIKAVPEMSCGATTAVRITASGTRTETRSLGPPFSGGGRPFIKANP